LVNGYAHIYVLTYLHTRPMFLTDTTSLLLLFSLSMRTA